MLSESAEPVLNDVGAELVCRRDQLRVNGLARLYVDALDPIGPILGRCVRGDLGGYPGGPILRRVSVSALSSETIDEVDDAVFGAENPSELGEIVVKE